MGEAHPNVGSAQRVSDGRVRRQDLLIAGGTESIMLRPFTNTTRSGRVAASLRDADPAPASPRGVAGGRIFVIGGFGIRACG